MTPNSRRRRPNSDPAALKPADGALAAAPRRCAPRRSSDWQGRRGADGNSHRQKPVKGLVDEVRAGLAELFSLPGGYEVALGNGGATAFWDAACFGFVERRALHLAFGEFSQKFATVTERRSLPGGSARRQGRAGQRARGRAGRGGACRRRRRCRYDRLGSQRDFDRRDGAGAASRRRRRCIGLIDATSGAGGLPLDVSQADAYYFAPQKCLPGMGGSGQLCSAPRRWSGLREIDLQALYTGLPVVADRA